jgi:predicted enzyme related to lactoylglutathione lyase
MQNATNAINWFDLPATDLDRAVTFYSTIFGIEMQRMEGGEMQSAFFPMQPQGVGGALTQGDGYTPTASAGPVIYLNGGDDLGIVLDKIESAGGQIVQPKTSIGEHGYVALFIDCEGNREGTESGCIR